MQLGNAIRAARGTTTQRGLAQLVGVDQGTVSKWERARVAKVEACVRAIQYSWGRSTSTPYC